MLQKSRKPMGIRKITEGYMNKILFGILLFCIVWGASFLFSAEAEAAGASISVTTKSNKVTEGDTVYVVITVRSAGGIKGFEGYFSYDNRILQFVTGGSVVHGNDDEFQISDMERADSAAKIKYSVKFRARKNGQTTIALKQPYNVVADDDASTRMSVSYNALDIFVEKKREEQNVISNMETPLPKSSTKPGKKALDSKGKKADAGKKAVPSPDASSAPKDAAKKEKADIGASPGIELMKITDASEIPTGFSETEFDIDGKTVTAYALKGNKESRYLLFYGKAENREKEDGTESEEMFYLYDKSSGALMPYDSVRDFYRSMNEKDLQADSSQRMIQSLKYVVAIMGIFCALMLLLAIAFRIRYSYRK